MDDGGAGSTSWVINMLMGSYSGIIQDKKDRILFDNDTIAILKN